jgi:FkbM family methyltransferase
MIVDRLQTWLLAPTAQKRRSLRYYARAAWNRALPNVPLPLRFAPGFWWIARHDATSDDLVRGTFEVNERQFLLRFLQPGMVVLDVGAHAGFYSLLASTLVGDTGRVIAFEPSPRERERLERHLRLNRRRNVTVEPYAVGEREGIADLFVFGSAQTGCNSFHLSNPDGARPVAVPVRRIDDCAAVNSFARCDLVKMDIEGAELSALRGAETLFRTRRPALLCELHEKRTTPWGYAARDIIDLVVGWDYRWFEVEGGGRLAPMDLSRAAFLCNGVALPNPR